MAYYPPSDLLGVQARDFFSRQISVSEIGTAGLSRLQDANVAVIGAGGVGSAAAWFLAGLGVGHLTLIDQDIVEVTNLHRVMGADSHHLNQPKGEAVARAIDSRYPWTSTKPVVETITQENSKELLAGAEFLVDGTDNFWTRKILNRYSIQNSVPYLFTSAIANQAHLCLFKPPRTACLECLFPKMEQSPGESCETLGVTSAIVGLAGNLAAMETAKSFLGLSTGILGRVLTIDLLGPDFLVTDVSRRVDCAACNTRPVTESSRGRTVMLCGDHVANVLPERSVSMDLLSVRDKIPRQKIVASSRSVVVFEENGHQVSLFRTGRLLIDRVPDEETALRIAGEIWAKVL